MKKYEYQHVYTDEYNIYLEKANNLLNIISTSLEEDITNLTYQDVIFYFQSNYNIHFAFFEAKPSEFLDGELGETPVKSDSNWIKYKELIPNASFEFLDNEIVERISGVTIPSGDRTLILINQDRPLQRIIFTILHEICHFYFHIKNTNNPLAFISLTSEQLEGQYSDEIIPFENEANIIGSILFCPTKKLEHMLLTKYPFKDMCRYTKMSESAMHNRLLNYFEHCLQLNYRVALSYVMKIRHGDINIYYAIIYKIKAKLKTEKEQEEHLIQQEIQAAYISKLKNSPFWDDILKELNMK